MPTIFNGGKGRSYLAAAMAVRNQAKGISKTKTNQNFLNEFLQEKIETMEKTKKPTPYIPKTSNGANGKFGKA
jgi:hypothetical protein